MNAWRIAESSARASTGASLEVACAALGCGDADDGADAPGACVLQPKTTQAAAQRSFLVDMFSIVPRLCSERLIFESCRRLSLARFCQRLVRSSPVAAERRMSRRACLHRAAASLAH